MRDTKILYSVLISFITFIFVAFLIYIIYCFGFYDNNQQTALSESYNQKRFDDIYENIEHNNLEKKNFEQVITLMYDQTKLEEIYKTYYENTNIWKDKLSFLSDFYYGENKIETDDIIYHKTGKTNLVSRAHFTIDTIKVKSKSGIESELGLATNIKLLIDQNGTLLLDNNYINCENNICSIPEIFKGLHEIKYESNGYIYYGLLNIKNDETISITNNDTLVTIKTNNTNQKVKKGYYYLKECYLESSCPSKSKSYIHIIDDKNIELKTYISLDQAGDYYKGIYEINNGFINMTFNNHTYQVFDYDTKRSTDINVDTDIKMSYRIINSESLKNDNYYFVFTN